MMLLQWYSTSISSFPSFHPQINTSLNKYLVCWLFLNWIKTGLGTCINIFMFILTNSKFSIFSFRWRWIGEESFSPWQSSSYWLRKELSENETLSQHFLSLCSSSGSLKPSLCWFYSYCWSVPREWCLTATAMEQLFDCREIWNIPRTLFFIKSFHLDFRDARTFSCYGKWGKQLFHVQQINPFFHFQIATGNKLQYDIVSVSECSAVLSVPLQNLHNFSLTIFQFLLFMRWFLFDNFSRRQTWFSNWLSGSRVIQASLLYLPLLARLWCIIIPRIIFPGSSIHSFFNFSSFPMNVENFLIFKLNFPFYLLQR